MNDERFAEERLRALDPAADWRPNVGRARAQMKARQRRPVAGMQRWALAAAAVCATVAIMMLAPSSGHCAGITCSQPVLEIYSDYECPPCADFYATAYPRLFEKYVKTGKVKLVHRDLPLPQHAFAKLAARYANAAREAGFYDAAAEQIFRTQAVWKVDGDIAMQLAKVLPADAMVKIREAVARGADDFAADRSAALADRINQVPALVVLVNGEREKIAPLPSYPVVEAYLDEVLKH